ncbi:hypothetical protein BGW42_003953 [Actinomortierella wolfii]|nr:hypothetical protein BGW42_003953 [Actinomortierella wolfii]
MTLRDPITLFHSRAVPPISIAAYLARIHRFIPLTNEVLLNAMIYLARLSAAGSGPAEEQAASSLAEAGAAAMGARTSRTTTSTTDIIDAGSQLSESELGQTLHRNMIHHGSSLVADWLLSSFAVDGSIVSTTTNESSMTAVDNVSNPGSSTASSTSTSSETSSQAAPTRFPAQCEAAHVSVAVSETDISCPSKTPHEQSHGLLVGCCCTTSSKVCVACAPAANASQLLHHSMTSALPRMTADTIAGCPSGGNSSQPTTAPRANKRPRSPSPISHCAPSPSLSSSGTATNASNTCANADEDASIASKRIKQELLPQGPLAPVSVKQQQQQYSPSSSSTPDLLATATKANPLFSLLAPALPHQTAIAPNGFRLNSLNIHRLLITALMIAAKFTSDLYYSNARYAKYGGLRLEELNQLELEFLFSIKFDLNVKVPHIQQVGHLLHVFEKLASGSASVASSPASSPAMVTIDRIVTSSAAVPKVTPNHAQHHPQSSHVHPSPISPTPCTSSSSTSPPYPAEADVAPHGQGHCQGEQKPKIHMQPSSKAVGQLLSPPEEKQQGWDE